MIGKPKHLNTREDYLYAKENFEASFWKPVFEALLQNQQQWFNAGPLTAGEAGQADDTHKIVESEGMAGGLPVRYQFELRDDPSSLLNRLGFTVAEVETLLSEGE